MTLITLMATGLIFCINASELKNVKEIQKIVMQSENKVIAKINKDKKAQEILQAMISKAAKQIEAEAKKGFKIGVILQIHYSNSNELLNKLKNYTDSEINVIYTKFYEALEKKGFTIKDKTYGGAIMSTKVYWQ